MEISAKTFILSYWFWISRPRITLSFERKRGVVDCHLMLGHQEVIPAYTPPKVFLMQPEL
jgi:hypothetical protein